MGAIVAQVLDSARTHLNDDEATLWNDQKLIPKLQEAYRELMSQLYLSGVPLTYATTSVLTVPADLVDGHNVDMSAVSGYPTNIIEPIYMKERSVGQLNTDFVDMTEVDFLPNLQKSTELIWWCWQGQKIMLLGALNAVEVQLRYMGSLVPPTKVTDDIVVIMGELYLSYRTASLAMEAARQFDVAYKLYSVAKGHLDTIIRINVKQLQNLPANRRPYHRGRGRSRTIRDF